MSDMLDNFLWRYVLDEDARHEEEIKKLITKMNEHYDNYIAQETIYFEYVGNHKVSDADKKRIKDATGFPID